MIKYKYSSDLMITTECMSLDSTLIKLQRMTHSDDPTSLLDFTKTLVQFVINHINHDNTLLGLFRLIKLSNKHHISPFLATSDYCIKVLSIADTASIKLNISPIYHLGPEYPEYYRQKQGKDLNREAIIGLMEVENHDPEKPSTFNIGIDAGIAFPQTKIPHNQTMHLNLNLIDEGISAELCCEKHSTVKIFTFADMGMLPNAYADSFSYNANEIWAA